MIEFLLAYAIVGILFTAWYVSKYESKITPTEAFICFVLWPLFGLSYLLDLENK